ncbi:MAG: methyltransferase domain-containing protein, partial [Pseudomonadota bacterium]
MRTSLSYLPNTPDTPRPWDIVADGYATGAMDFFRAYSEAALDFVPVEPGHHIADIACGPGTLSLIAARKGVSVSALDFSTNMLRHLESRITADGLNTISTH